MYNNEMEERKAAEELARVKGYPAEGKWLQMQYKLIEKKWLLILKKEAGVVIRGPSKKRRMVFRWIDLQKYSKIPSFDAFFNKHLEGYKPDRPNSGPVVYAGARTTYRRYYLQGAAGTARQGEVHPRD